MIMFIDEADPKYEVLAYNLYRFGFPMMYDGLDTTNLSLEKTIVTILKEHPNPRFVLGLPVVIHKNRINTSRLYTLAIKTDAVNEVGWILEEAYTTYERCMGIKKSNIARLICRLEPLKKKKIRVISVEGVSISCFIHYARERQTSTGKKWKIFSGHTEDSFDYEFKRRCMKSLDNILAKVLPRI